MIYLALQKSPRMAPLQKAPLIFRLFLTSVAILVVMIAMAAVELQNEQFERLATPSQSSLDDGWYLRD
jgi:nitrogen fixation-related uncharacterized protein